MRHFPVGLVGRIMESAFFWKYTCIQIWQCEIWSEGEENSISLEMKYVRKATGTLTVRMEEIFHNKNLFRCIYCMFLAN
jgi:hypothetical protein